MYTKIILNTKFVYNLYTKIVQIKILYDNEYTKSVYQIPKHIQKMYKLYKSCAQFRLKTAWNLKYMFIVYTNNIQTTKTYATGSDGLCIFFVHTNNVKTIHKLYN